MKRLWIRAHALPNVIERSAFVATGSVEAMRNAWDAAADLIVEIEDDFADAVMRDGYLITCGKVLADGEDPPYVGSDTPDAGVR